MAALPLLEAARRGGLIDLKDVDLVGLSTLLHSLLFLVSADVSAFLRELLPRLWLHLYRSLLGHGLLLLHWLLLYL